VIFDAYVGIDWSGARGKPQRGIQVAWCRPGSGQPQVVSPPGRAWSRPEVRDWLSLATRRQRLLVGLDFSFTFPFVDAGAYFPGADSAPASARALWRLVEDVCTDDDTLYGGAFADRAPWSAYFFRRKGARGVRFERRHKLVEKACADAGLGHPETVFHLIGPKQVGLGSLSGMRLLQALGRDDIAPHIWPMDVADGSASVLVEVFPRAFLAAAGHGAAKVRQAEQLNAVLRFYGVHRPSFAGVIDDNVADAVVAAAALRALAPQEAVWRPAGLTARVRRTEGWIFGMTGP
jgi:hypothetical protein